MPYQKFTSEQTIAYTNHENAMQQYGLEVMERTILRTREIPIAYYPNGNWYTVYAIHSPQDGTASYIMRDGNLLSEKDFNTWIENKPASLTIVYKYYYYYKSVVSVAKKLFMRREILDKQKKPAN